MDKHKNTKTGFGHNQLHLLGDYLANHSFN
jgi:hypothetical protein